MADLKIKDIETLEVLSPDELEQVVGGDCKPDAFQRKAKRRLKYSSKREADSFLGALPDPFIIVFPV